MPFTASLAVEVSGTSPTHCEQALARFTDRLVQVDLRLTRISAPISVAAACV